ncbi:hypothetical protein K402DRAFT_459537 [Aulographum hederae CBS 113979]|uniref:Low temperature requirement A n=1 Tax=Aulographum hederae CBS 113979 TaxID=1176131 RepID=A0A6G1HEA4_9PEZI|nr:hypothetical protein K402DRAFT_459537 [Aulographum hederae CBS 113979]
MVHEEEPAETHRYDDVELLEERKKAHIKWIDTPLKDASYGNRYWDQRHEASTVELFFDLYFVANLTTFTANHAIVDIDSLLAYCGFFVIIWATWFQITIHDTRFALDTVYERLCKVLQFIHFVLFALVGANFKPASDPGHEGFGNLRILSVTLCVSRIFLAIQYIVVLGYCRIKLRRELYLPLSLNVVIYLLMAGLYGGIAGGLLHADHIDDARPLYIGWYIGIFLELAGSMAITMIWRTLSFTRTHLHNRMGLLTLIVIGEGAIRVTKTISKVMSRGSLTAEGCLMVFCIILILVFVWTMYFDHHPTGHYGCVRQQLWAVMHLPLNLAIIGVVEGAQQVALVHYMSTNWFYYVDAIQHMCGELHLDGDNLALSLFKMLGHFKFREYLSLMKQVHGIDYSVYEIGHTPGICSVEATQGVQHIAWDPKFPLIQNLTMEFAGGLFLAIDDEDMPPNANPSELLLSSIMTVYIYFWTSVLAILVCFVVMMYLVRRYKADVADYLSIGARFAVVLVACGLLSLYSSESYFDSWLGFISSLAMLPTLVALLLVIIIADRMGSWWSIKRLTKKIARTRLDERDAEIRKARRLMTFDGDSLRPVPTNDPPSRGLSFRNVALT